MSPYFCANGLEHESRAQTPTKRAPMSKRTELMTQMSRAFREFGYMFRVRLHFLFFRDIDVLTWTGRNACALLAGASAPFLFS